MQLNDEQNVQIRKWAEEGCGLSEIQRRLADTFQLKLTFMDVRFLVLELGIEIQDKSKRESKTASKTSKAGTPVGQDDVLADDTMPGHGVRVDVDRVMKPGALVSGTAVFSDGVSTTWMLDQMGRLALQGPNPEYRPSPEDIQEFQLALQEELAKRGY